MLLHVCTISWYFLLLSSPPVKSDIQEEKHYQCSSFCSCVPMSSPGGILATCNVTGYQHRSTWELFGANYSCITALNLSHTSLKHLNMKMFQNLTGLRTLYLAFNDMRSWQGKPTRDLPNLVYLYVEGNPKWLPGNELSEFPSLKKIYGVWWRKECGLCSLERDIPITNTSSTNHNGTRTCGYNAQDNLKTVSNDSDESFQEQLENMLLHFSFPDVVEYGQLLLYLEQGNIVECEQDELCLYYEVAYIWDKVRSKVLIVISYVQYILGTFALLSNFIVMATVVAKVKLRTTVSFVLIAILAASDFLTGLYSIMQAKLKSYISFSQLDIQPQSIIYKFTNMCFASGYIFTTAQVTSSTTSLLLTIERYFVIVYGLNPEKRLTKKIALVCSLIGWIVAMVTAAVPLFVYEIWYHGMSHCSLPNTFESGAPGYVRIAVYMATGILVIPYLMCIILYVKMHKAVKKLGQKMGHRADSRMAKKIALIVISNLFFFIIPNVLLNIHANFLGFFEDHVLVSVPAHAVYFSVFISLPLLCFSINACLNPFLFAMRNDTFKQQLKSLVTGIIACKMGNLFLCKAKSTNRQRIQVIPDRHCENDNGQENPAFSPSYSLSALNSKMVDVLQSDMSTRAKTSEFSLRSSKSPFVLWESVC